MALLVTPLVILALLVIPGEPGAAGHHRSLREVTHLNHPKDDGDLQFTVVIPTHHSGPPAWILTQFTPLADLVNDILVVWDAASPGSIEQFQADLDGFPIPYTILQDQGPSLNKRFEIHTFVHTSAVFSGTTCGRTTRTSWSHGPGAR